MGIHIEVIIRGTCSDTKEVLRKYALRRLSFAVRRFEHRVRHMTVRFVDMNGPRRGVDSRCTLTADLGEGGPLFVEATAASPFAALALAALRLSEALRRYAGYTARRGRSADTARHQLEKHLRIA